MFDICASFQNKVFSFYPRGGLASSVATSLSGANTPISVLLGRETGKGLCLLLSKVCLACPATVLFHPVPGLPPFLYSGSKSVCQVVQSLCLHTFSVSTSTSGLRPFICR